MMKDSKGNGFVPFVIMLVIGLLLLKYFTGVSFWLIAGVILFFSVIQFIWPGSELIYKSKPVAILLVTIFISSLGVSFWKTNFHRSYSKIETAKSIADQKIAKNMGDNTQTDAVDIWQIQKDRASKEFLIYYNYLLEKGKTKEAVDTLQGFNKKWDMDFLKEQAEKNRQAKLEKKESVEPIKSPTDQVKDSIFTKGTYYINVKGKTSFNIVIVPTKNGCARYALSSEKFNHAIIFSDGETIQDGPDVVLAYRQTPTFRLFSQTGDVVKLVVS